MLAHNLHGVDIDPRCAQIAQLALWMRAQKAYRDFGIGRAERAQIRRSNIVVAEPLVADEQIAKEFVAKLGDAELGRVFTSLVESLNLAGDLGLLLRVEQLVARQAKRGQTGDLFAPPEERIRAALDRFVSDEASAANTRRRLFADDAAHGVALLGVAEKKFDVVLMNPPFGGGSTTREEGLREGLPADEERHLRGLRRARHRAARLAGTSWCDHVAHRLLPSRASRSGARKCSSKTHRLSWSPTSGLGVMDAAMVEAAAYCLEKAIGEAS